MLFSEEVFRVWSSGTALQAHFPASAPVYLCFNAHHLFSFYFEFVFRLKILYLGGNRLTELPDCVGTLNDLEALILSDNQLENLPASVADLKKLKSLLLHKNRLRALPTEIIALKCLSEVICDIFLFLQPLRLLSLILFWLCS